MQYLYLPVENVISVSNSCNFFNSSELIFLTSSVLLLSSIPSIWGSYLDRCRFFLHKEEFITWKNIRNKEQWWGLHNILTGQHRDRASWAPPRISVMENVGGVPLWSPAWGSAWSWSQTPAPTASQPACQYLYVLSLKLHMGKNTFVAIFDFCFNVWW